MTCLLKAVVVDDLSKAFATFPGLYANSSTCLSTEMTLKIRLSTERAFETSLRILPQAGEGGLSNNICCLGCSGFL